jgi:hypothetical protein
MTAGDRFIGGSYFAGQVLVMSRFLCPGAKTAPIAIWTRSGCRLHVGSTVHYIVNLTMDWAFNTASH